MTPSDPDILFYFSPSGNIDWQVEADPPLLNRDGQPFDRAWVFKHIVVVPASSGPKVWVAMGNNAGWAGCVLRIDADGAPEVHFANAGYVERMCPVHLNTRDFLIICGENNDFDDAFVALIEIDDRPACSVPGERLVYRFANAPSGVPRKYILFPRSEVSAAY